MILRDTLRSLGRSPWLTATVVLTLSAGMGLSVATIAIVDRAFYRPIGLLRDPDNVQRVYLQRSTPQGVRLTNHSMSYGHFLNFQATTSSFSDMAVFSDRLLAVGSGEGTRERTVAAVSATFFDFFEGRPALGRYFAPTEDVLGAGAPAAVLSYRFWESEFGKTDVLGRSLEIGDLRATIIGVAPEGLLGIDDANPPAVYIPVSTSATAMGLADDPTFYKFFRLDWATVLVRRAPGVTVDRASADLQQAYLKGWADERVSRPTLPVPEEAHLAAFVGPVRRAAGPAPLAEMQLALWVSGLSLVVLLVASANVAHLLLARALDRTREHAVRLAMGASHFNIAVGALAESTCLAIAGAAGASLICLWAGPPLQRILLPFAGGLALTAWDTRLVLLILIITAAVALATGLLPAFVAVRRSPAGANALGARVRGGSKRANRLRGILVVSQAAFSVALLIGAAAFGRSMAAIKAVSLGFDYDEVLVVTPIERGAPLDASGRLQLRRALRESAEALPTIERAAWAGAAPLWRSFQQPLFVSGIDAPSKLGQISSYVVEPPYFDVLKTRIVRGRTLTTEDRLGSPLAAVVSESMAHAFWPNRDPLGECLRVGTDTASCTRVVGVAENVLQSGQYQRETPRFQYYLSFAQQPVPVLGFLMLRLRSGAAVSPDEVRNQLQRNLPGNLYLNVEAMAPLLSNARRPWQLGALLFSVGGIFAAVVATIGLYSAIRYNVAHRTHELVLRFALGAQRDQIAGMVVGQGLAFGAAGVVLGTSLAWLCSSWIQPLLYRQSAADPWVYGLVAAVVVGGAGVAALPVAIRATRANLNLALRAD